MARPSTSDISHGTQGWDTTLNDWRAAQFDNPYPVPEVANYAALPSAALYDRCLVTTIDTNELWMSDGTNWNLVAQGPAPASAYGASWKVESAVEELDLSISTISSNLFPSGTRRIGALARVTQIITGTATAWGMEDSGGVATDLYSTKSRGLTLGSLLNASDWTADPTTILSAAEGVIVTPFLGGFTGGKIRVAAFFERFTPPTS